MFCVFGREACGILVPWPGIEPAPPALEGEVSTTELPGKSLVVVLIYLFSLMTNDLENLFINLLAIWYPFFVKWLLNILPISENGLFSFFFFKI